jgi:hypothetical protein
MSTLRNAFSGDGLLDVHGEHVCAISGLSSLVLLSSLDVSHNEVTSLEVQYCRIRFTLRATHLFLDSTLRQIPCDGFESATTNSPRLPRVSMYLAWSTWMHHQTRLDQLRCVD